MASIVWAPARELRFSYILPEKRCDSQARLQDEYRQSWTKKINPNARAALPEIWKKKKPGCGGLPSAFLVLLATGLAALSWERLQDLPYHLGAISIGLLVLAILFAAYVYGRRREVSELKHLLTDLHDRAGVTPSDEQLDQLSQVIQRSQRSFKELIDSFDDVAFACSLDGTLRTVNRRVTQLLGLAYTDVVGPQD